MGETAKWLDMPMLVGEWGAYGRYLNTLPAAWDVVRQFEKQLCSDTYWAYEPGIEAFPCFQALQRPYPQRVCGTLDHYRYDPRSGVLECAWTEREGITAPSQFYVPDWFPFDPNKVELTLAAGRFEVTETHPGSKNLILTIPPAGQARVHRLVARTQRKDVQ